MFTADWALRRVLKFALKRAVGRFLRAELDLEQLDVQLGAGAVELRGVLLDCDALTERLVSARG
jgi:autophagy-related protein 2